MTVDDPYVDPATGVLHNRLGITDSARLDRAERLLVTQRLVEGTPKGPFDLDHLCAIHRHLFQDVYSWAGQLRTVDLDKGDTQFMPASWISRGMDDVYWRLAKTEFLQGLNADQFAIAAADVMADVNHIHPFREGNGRTQLQYFQQLAGQAGHTVDLRLIDRDHWLAASIASQTREIAPMTQALRNSVTGPATSPDLAVDHGIDR